MSNGIRQCWSLAKIGDVGEVRLGRQRSPKNRSLDHPTKYLRAGNITWTGVDLSDVMDMEFQPRELGIYRLHVGDVLLSEASGSASEVGKSAIWNGQIEDCCFQNTVVRFRSHGSVTPKFAHLAFSHFARNGIFARISKGVGIFHLSADRFSEMELPVPPLAEQDRIVAKVEELFSDLEAGVAALERVRAKMKRYRASVLNAAVTGKLIETTTKEPFEKSNWQPLEHATCDLEQGWSPKCERVATNDPAEWAVMTTTAIQPMRFDGMENKLLPPSLKPRTNLELKAGDVLITRAGPKKSGGSGMLCQKHPAPTHPVRQGLSFSMRSEACHWAVRRVDPQCSPDQKGSG